MAAVRNFLRSSLMLACTCIRLDLVRQYDRPNYEPLHESIEQF